MKKSTDLVVKANSINEGFIDMTKLQYKLTLYALSKINKSDKEFRKVYIYEKELKEILEWKSENLYEYLKGFEKELISKSISLHSINGNRVNINWYSYTKYNNKEGCLEIAFNSDLAPYLLEIDIPFTKYLLNNVKNLSSKHATRIYELLIQYRNTGKVTWSRIIEIEDLRRMLGIPEDKYRLYGDLKRRVILQSQKEFKKNSDTDIIFDFEEIKTGRSVTAINFLVKYKKEQTKDIPIAKVPMELIETFITKFNTQNRSNLAGTKQTKKLVIDLINQKGLEHFEKCLTDFGNVIIAEARKGNIRSLEGLFMNFTKNGYNFNTSMMGEVGMEPNFDQRKYTEEDFEKYYYKVKE